MVKLRFPRKIVFVVSGVVVLGGATGAAALFIGRDAILGPSAEELSGVSCTDVVRVAELRKGRGPWLRKYVKVPPGTDGMTRAKTAIRVAAKVQETLPADLIEIAVLDDSGPEKRAFMRGRAIGAEVILVKDPGLFPDISGKYTVRYYEGGASGTGMFYGRAEEMSSHEAEDLLSKMQDLTDCAPPPGKEDASAEKGGHGGGEAKASGHGEAAKAEGGHEAPPEGHGEQPAGEAHGDAAAAEEKSGGMLSGMLSMVGLGGSEAPAEGHGAKPDAGAHEAAAPAGAEGHTAPADVPEGKSFMSKMLGMVGFGGDGKVKPTIENSGGPAIFGSEAKPHDGEAGQPAPADHGASADHGAAADHAVPADHAPAADHAASGQPLDHSAPADHAAPAHAADGGHPASEGAGHGAPAEEKKPATSDAHSAH